MCLTVYLFPAEELQPADSCPPAMDTQLDWLMLRPSLRYHQAMADVGWPWCESVVRPQPQLWGVWLGSRGACLLHAPLCCAASQTPSLKKCWTEDLSSGSQVCSLGPHAHHMFLFCHFFFTFLYFLNVDVRHLIFTHHRLLHYSCQSFFFFLNQQ